MNLLLTLSTDGRFFARRCNHVRRVQRSEAWMSMTTTVATREFGWKVCHEIGRWCVVVFVLFLVNYQGDTYSTTRLALVTLESQ